MKRLLLPALLCAAMNVQADTPQQVLAGLITVAGGKALPSQGEKLFRGKFSGGKSAESCTACHSDDPKAVGQHIKTHKAIDPSRWWHSATVSAIRPRWRSGSGAIARKFWGAPARPRKKPISWPT